jgi:hypothetical protein
MNTIEEQLTAALRRRDTELTVHDELDAILNDDLIVRSTPPRHTRARRPLLLAVAAASVVVVGAGALIWAQHTRNTPTATSNRPTPGVSVLAPSPTPDQIDAYPVINWPAKPIPGVHASHGSHDDDQGWVGTIGRSSPDGTPTTIIGVHVFPKGVTPFPDATQGRTPGILENLGDDITSLTTTINGFSVVVAGDDINLLYDIVATVEPTVVDDQLDGYTFSRSLPSGLVELEPPQHSVPMVTPYLSTDDGTTLSVTIEQGAVLSNLVGRNVEPITINGRNGYRTTSGTPTIVIAVSTDETLYISSTIVDIDQLTDIANNITLVDQSTWDDLYDMQTDA